MMSRRLYAFLLWLLTPVVLGYTLWRAWRRPAYRERWWERFGWVPRRSDRPIWIHAVSVGETIAAIPLVRALQARERKAKDTPFACIRAITSSRREGWRGISTSSRFGHWRCKSSSAASAICSSPACVEANTQTGRPAKRCRH